MVRLPAMEGLVGRLPAKDLLVLSGFIYACLETHAQLAFAATQQLARSRGGSPVADAELINTIEDSLKHILRGSGSLSATIRERFERLTEAEPDREILLKLREKLRRLFPDTPIDSD